MARADSATAIGTAGNAALPVTLYEGGSTTMVGTRVGFIGELAPCGKVVDGEHYRDEDDAGLVIRDEYYRCGCRRILHLYHDGSVHSTAIRHNGTVVRERFSTDHGF